MLMEKTRGRSRTDDRQGARDFALWIGIAQMSQARSGWVRQDVRAGLDRQDLLGGGKGGAKLNPKLLENLMTFLFFTPTHWVKRNMMGLGIGCGGGQRKKKGGGGGAGLVINILVGERFPKNRINGV